MDNSTLFAIAKADLKTAKGLVNSKDKYQKHQAAYFVQQSIEKTIKYCIGLKTGTEPWGHDISKLILAADVEGIDVPDIIRQNAAMYTSWEAVSRYYPRTIIRRDTIAKAIRIVDDWQRKVSKDK
ncbi:MAG: HEPN domain-containing protein [Lachnospiraceae bacterium]|nr:HEPN domain-containing protein [Lachnospiraceae bacterium]